MLRDRRHVVGASRVLRVNVARRVAVLRERPRCCESDVAKRVTVERKSIAVLWERCRCRELMLRGVWPCCGGIAVSWVRRRYCESDVVRHVAVVQESTAVLRGAIQASVASHVTGAPPVPRAGAMATSLVLRSISGRY